MEVPSFNDIWWFRDVVDLINEKRPRSVQEVLDTGVKEIADLTEGRSPWPFYCCYLLPFIYLCTLYVGGFALYTIPLLTLVVVPLLEVGLGSDPGGELVPDRRFNLAIYLWIIPHLLTLMVSAWVIDQMSLFEVIGMVISSGMIIGSIGFTVAHELIHRNSSNVRLLGQSILLSMFYGHFYFEHVLGHHAKLCTDGDTSTSKRDETIHQFLYRSIRDGYLQSWQIVNKFNRSHVLWTYHIIELLYVWFLVSWFGWTGLLYVVCSSLVAILLLESVNYIEHYGLSRDKDSPISEDHSWNTNSLVTNLLLFRLQRHSGHHINSKRHYPSLVEHPSAPQLPTGYGGCLILAHIPWLWFYLMNPRLDQLVSRRKKLF